jgi:hypothetical protein
VRGGETRSRASATRSESTGEFRRAHGQVRIDFLTGTVTFRILR